MKNENQAKFDRIHDLVCRPNVVVPVSFFILTVLLITEFGLKKYYTKELIEILEQKGQFKDEFRPHLYKLDIHRTKRLLNYARKPQNKQISAPKLMCDFFKEDDPNSANSKEFITYYLRTTEEMR